MSNILRNADIRNSKGCRWDSSEGYSIRWDTDDDFRGYTVYSGLTARLVVNGVYFFVSTGESCSVTSANDVTEIDSGVYTHVKIGMRIEPGALHKEPTTGRIDFRTSDDVGWVAEKQVSFTVIPDNKYREYVIDFSQNEEWQGKIVRLRISPFLDGDSGQKVFIRYLKVISLYNFSCATRFNTPVCDHYTRFVHPCPFRGSGGKVVGSSVEERLTIVQNVNDKLVVNINGFGIQSITLDPVVEAEQKTIARDIETKLNLVGIGGYSDAECSIENAAFIIEGGAPDSLSSIEILEPESRSAGKILGFFDSSGNNIHTDFSGENAASRYEPEGTYRISSMELNNIYSQDTLGSVALFSVDPSKYTPQGGNDDYANVDRTLTYAFPNQTFIDYNNPITENGVLVKAYFSGTAHTNTEFRVYRQSLDGSISLVGSINFGSASDNNSGKIFEVACEMRVQKGDLIALYSASIHIGTDTTNPNFSYFLYNGDLQYSAFPLRLYGDGETGGPIFCRGSLKSDKAVLIVSFDRETSIESLTVRAEEDTPKETIPLTKLRSGGLNGGPYITGYTGYGANGTKAPGWTGLEYITDTLKQDVNAPSPSAYPMWWGGGSESNYNFTEAGIILDFAPNTDVVFDIDRVVVYFGAAKNIKSFTLDYPYVTNKEDTTRAWATVASVYDEVYIDDALSPTTRYYYTNPSKVVVKDYNEDYVVLQYRKMDFRFPAVKARSIRYRGYLERSDADRMYYADTYADFPIYIDPRIQEIEVFASTTPDMSVSDNFELSSSADGGEFLLHSDKDELSGTDTRFIIGYPIKSFKLIINPNSLMSISGFIATKASAEIRPLTSFSDNQEVLNVSINNSAPFVKRIDIINDSGQASNFFIDLADEEHVANRCILWNKLGSTTEIQNSELGPGGVLYKRENFKFRAGNVALNAPAYVMDPNFLFDRPCYISLDSESTWTDIGNTVVDGNKLNYVTNENALYAIHYYVYVVIDCGKSYDFLNIFPVKATSSLSDAGWDTTIWYSSEDCSSPEDIPDDSWYMSYPYGARWLKLRCPSCPVGVALARGLRTFAYITAILDIESSLNRRNGVRWLEEPHLTNGIAGSGASGSPYEGWTYYWKYYYYCVNLTRPFDITAIIRGPWYCFDAPDTNTCTILDGDRAHNDIAYSGTVTDDPSKVKWQPFGQPPSGLDRWVLYRGSICDELSVFVNDTTSLAKSVFELPFLWAAEQGEPYVDMYEYCQIAGGCISLDYPAAPLVRREGLRLTSPMGYDNDLAQRDVLGICLYISDVSQLDTSYGYFRMGRYVSEGFTFQNQSGTVDESNFFVWDIEDIGSSLVTGWNIIQLPFTNNKKVGEPRFTQDISGASAAQRRSRFADLMFVFRGVVNNTPFTVKLDSLEILRAYFPISKFGSGVYLAGEDYLKFSLNGFNAASGCIEFFLDPDWAKDVSCNSCNDLRTHTIFRFINPYGYLMELMMTTSGLKVFLSNSTFTLVHGDDASGSLLAGQRNHFAFTWDIYGNGATVFEIYINGVLSSTYYRSSLQGDFDVRQHKHVFLLFGGKAWDGFTTGYSSGLEGVIDNVKVYNYSKRDFSYSLVAEDFPSPKKSRDLVELSLDGSNFYGYEDRGVSLPLLIKNVAPGATFSFYVRARDLDKVGEVGDNRRTTIEVIRSLPG